jgi:hypothetical protein
MSQNFYFLDFDNYRSQINNFLIKDLTNIVEKYICQNLNQKHELFDFLYFMNRADEIEPFHYIIMKDNISLPEEGLIYDFKPKGHIDKFLFASRHLANLSDQSRNRKRFIIQISKNSIIHYIFVKVIIGYYEDYNDEGGYIELEQYKINIYWSNSLSNIPNIFFEI